MSRSLSPTFTLSTKAVNLLTDIAAKAEWYAIHMENSNAQLFCQTSLTKTIYGNLAIAGSTLTEELVHEVVNGKEIVAPVNDIMQAKNAAGVYEVFTQIDPFNVDDLLNAHGMMMKGLTAEVGRFRSTGVGVYVGSQCVHFGPPADRVPYLIQDLFDWLRNVEDNLIIRACVCHYVLEFIHPFTDGNGRVGRLWQSLILSKYNKVFQSIPVESTVYLHIKEYFDAIKHCNDTTDSGPFIDFMFQMIADSLITNQATFMEMERKDQRPTSVGGNVGHHVGENVGGIGTNKHDNMNEGNESKHETKYLLTAREKKIIGLIGKDENVSAAIIAKKLKVAQRTIERDMEKLEQAGCIQHVGSDKGGHWVVNMTN